MVALHPMLDQTVCHSRGLTITGVHCIQTSVSSLLRRPPDDVKGLTVNKVNSQCKPACLEELTVCMSFNSSTLISISLMFSWLLQFNSSQKKIQREMSGRQDCTEKAIKMAHMHKAWRHQHLKPLPTLKLSYRIISHHLHHLSLSTTTYTENVFKQSF